MIGIFLLFIVATFSRFVEKSSLVWVAIGYFIATLASIPLSGEKIDGELIAAAVILTVAVFFWMRLLHAAQDKIFLYFATLFAGILAYWYLVIS